MTTAASLKSKTVKELGKLAQKHSITGWQSMRKDDLIKAIVKASKSSASSKASPKKKAAAKKSSPARSTKKSATKKSVTKKVATKKTTASTTKSKTATKKAKTATKKKTTKAGQSTSSSSRKGTARVASTTSPASKRKSTKTTGSRTNPKAKPTTSSRTKKATPKTRTSTASAKTKSSTAKKSAPAVKAPAAKATKPKTTPAPSAKTKATTKTASTQAHKRATEGIKTQTSALRNGKAGVTKQPKPQGRVQSPPIRVEPQTNTAPRVLKRIQTVQANRERLRDLTSPNRNGSAPSKDRIALLVRDPYWLQAHWELTRATVERGQIALAEQWHTAIPILRLMEIEDVSTTNTSERILKDIEIHGEVTDWYVDVPAPNTAYRAAIGYKTATGRFHVLARSNKVVTPSPGTSDSIDENWSDIAENCEKIFAMSGGYDSENPDGELRELFEERLRRPMGSPVVTRFGMGAEGLLNRKRDFKFEVDAEMIIYGATQPNAYVTLAGEPVKLRPDGTFTVRLSMPDRRQVLPVVASSSDGVEQHTTVLAVERNTKVMEPLIKESSD